MSRLNYRRLCKCGCNKPTKPGRSFIHGHHTKGKAPNYKHGLCAKEKEWKEAVFIRDNYTCRRCFSKKKLCAHHIKNKKKYPKLIFNLDNGQTLCRECHTSSHTTGRRHSEESKRRMGNSKQGVLNPMYGKVGYWSGKKRPRETNRKISITLSGRKLSKETVRKMIISAKKRWEER